MEDLDSIPGLGRSLGEGNGYPLQYSGLENSMDREAWRATVHGVSKSWTRLSDFHFQAGKKIQIPNNYTWGYKEFTIRMYRSTIISLVQFSHSVMPNSLWSHGLQHTRLPCPSPTPRACANSCPSSRWCHPTISSSIVPFSSLQSFPASGSFPMSQFFASGGQSIGASASESVLPKNI